MTLRLRDHLCGPASHMDIRWWLAQHCMVKERMLSRRWDLALGGGPLCGL